MSMNLNLSAERVVTISNKQKRKQTIHFQLWQTPTEVTRAILAKHDRLAAYTEWVNTLRHVVLVPARNDNGVEIGTKEYSFVDEHLRQLNEWITECNKECYTFVWYET